MEQFYKQPASLWRTTGAIRTLAFLDLFSSVAYLYLILIWPNKGQTFTLITLFQVLHLFSWTAGLASSSGMYAHEYILMTGMVYIVAFLADLGSMIWRIVILNTHDSFQLGAFILNVLLVAIDIIMTVILGLLLTKAKEFKDSINVALAQSVSTELLITQYRKQPYDLFRDRNYVRIVSMIDLFLFIALAVMFALGLSVDQTFANLTYMQLPHAYLWIAGMGINKEILEWGFIIFFCIQYFIALLLDVTSLFWRIILVSECTNCSVFVVFGWIMVGIVAAMTVVSFAQFFLGIRVYKMLIYDFNRLLKLVAQNLHQYSSRFFAPRR